MGESPESPSTLTRSLAKTKPRMLSRSFSNTGMREYSSSAKRARNWSTVASWAMATMSGRGVITSRTSVPPKSTTDCRSRRSSVSAASARVSSSSPSASFAPPLPRPLAGRPRRGRARSISQPVTGPRTRSARSNDGSSSSSTRPALRRARAEGTTCSQTRTNPTMLRSSTPTSRGVATPMSWARMTAARAKSPPRRRRVTT